MAYYESYLGSAVPVNQNGANKEPKLSLFMAIVHFVTAGLITSLLVVVCKYFCKNLDLTKQSQINFDCEQAIKKKQRLEKTSSLVTN